METSRVGHVAPQRHRLRKPRLDGAHPQHVAVRYGQTHPPLVEPELHDPARPFHDPLEGGPLPVGQGRQPPRHRDQVAHRLLPLELVNGRVLHAPRGRHLGADGGDVDHVPGKQAHVPGLVPPLEEVVEVDFRHDRRPPLQLDPPHGALRRRAARGEQGVHHGAQGTHRVGTGAPGVAHDEDLDRAQLPHVHTQVEIAEDAFELRAEEVGELAELDARHRDAAGLGDIHRARPVYDEVQVHIHLPPDPQENLVTGADHVVRRHRDPVERRERRRHPFEKRGPVDREQNADRRGGKALEFTRRLGLRHRQQPRFGRGTAQRFALHSPLPFPGGRGRFDRPPLRQLERVRGGLALGQQGAQGAVALLRNRRAGQKEQSRRQPGRGGAARLVDRNG